MEPSPARTPPPAGRLLVTGTGCASRLIDVGDLRARSRVRLDVDYVTRRKRERHEVHGVHLYDVLREGPLPLDPRHKMSGLTVVVLAVSEDGFRVVLSLAEIDPEFGHCAALLATRYNGEDLPRPTLVMPSDLRASRYVRNLAELCLLTVSPTAP
ncbi:molybdopterin-binding protein [Amycolatopsis sp. OK19-0408]|uniref:Molybdopterin-binding protein n=1 Tax=Amycolatopsis iheyensis TaxID=2945988 RepID=A0A9X2NMH5_9PSEU|nr:molybdopterin-binding protein [Amycolatopsis iheyensis]MCR6489077.1 molybdopterin-binding protein [Amycolatopsis iheyensis]